MSCAVKLCKNRSDRKNKNHGITYHRFPKENEVWRNDWIQIIRNCNDENDWIPSKYSVICSLHFKANDLYTTKGGLQRRVVTYAVPQKFLFEPTQMAEDHPADVPYIPSVSQESTSETVPALEHPGSSTMILQREYLPAEPNISNALREGISVIKTEAIEQPDTSTLVFREEQPAEPYISSNIQEGISVIKTEALEQPDTSTLVFREEQPAEPYISSNIQEGISVIKTEALEQPDTSTLVFLEEQPAEPYISSNIQENSSEIGADEEKLLSVLYSPRKRRLKQSLMKKQDIIKKQKREIKTLKQKVKRLQNRNKSLKEILKSHSISIPF